MQIKYSVI